MKWPFGGLSRSLLAYRIAAHDGWTLRRATFLAWFDLSESDS